MNALYNIDKSTHFKLQIQISIQIENMIIKCCFDETLSINLETVELKVNNQIKKDWLMKPIENVEENFYYLS